MNQAPAISLVVQAKRKAENGVDYSPRHGARCPWCARKTATYCTRPWEGPARIRFHRCTNAACVLASMGVSIKSLEEDLRGNG